MQTDNLYTNGMDGKPRIFSRQRVLLELITFFYFVGKNSVIPLSQQYVYQFVSRKYNYTDFEAGHTEECYLYDEEQAMLRAKVNEESSLIVLYLNIAELLPSAIVVLFLGFYSDMTGKRKFLMWLPCLGNAIYCLGFLIPTFMYGGDYNTGAVIIMVTSTIMCGLSGNVPGFFAGNATYISDTDSRERRTLRLAIVEFTVGFTYGVSNLGFGFWVRAAGFVPPLWFAFACSILPMGLVIFGLQEPDHSDRIRNPTIQDVRSIRHICGCSTISQRKLWAMFFAFQIYVFVQQGQERTYVPFLEHAPLCWGSVGIGLFLFALYFISGLGSWPAVPLMHRCIGDVAIFIIAIMSKGVGSVLLAFANNKALVYLCKYAPLFANMCIQETRLINKEMKMANLPFLAQAHKIHNQSESFNKVLQPNPREYLYFNEEIPMHISSLNRDSLYTLHRASTKFLSKGPHLYFL